MKTILLSLLIFLVLSCDNSVDLQAQEKKQQAFDETIKINARMEATSGANVSFRCVTRVKPLETGKKYKIVIDIANASGSDIKFDRISTSCQCGSFDLEKNVIGSTDSTEAIVSWLVPSSSQSKHATVIATLFNQGREIAEIRLAAYLKSNFYVGLETGGRRIDGGLFEWQVPIIVSSPLTLKELELSLSSNMDGFSVDLVEQKQSAKPSSPTTGDDDTPKTEQGWAVIRAHESIVGNEYRFGELIVIDPVSQKRNKHELALYAQPPVRVSPAQITFRPTEEGSESVTCTALIQLDNKFFDGRLKKSSAYHTDKEAEFFETLEAKLTLDEKPVVLEVIHLGKQVYRLKVKMKRDDFEASKELDGKWSIVVGDNSFEIPTSGILR